MCTRFRLTLFIRKIPGADSSILFVAAWVERQVFGHKGRTRMFLVRLPDVCQQSTVNVRTLFTRKSALALIEKCGSIVGLGVHGGRQMHQHSPGSRP